MKRIGWIIFTLLLMCSTSWAQITKKEALTSSHKISGVVNEIGAGVSVHTLTWNVTGTLSGCSVKVQQSADNASWSDLITAQTCTSNGGPTTPVTGTVVNYVRINATTLTGTGTLTVFYTGSNTTSSSVVTVSGNVASTTADCADAVLGCKADAKSTATDTTAITLMQTQKEISFQLQAIAGGTASSSVTDPCYGTAKTHFNITISSATTTVFAAASASNKIYICSLVIFPISADDHLEFVEDASGSCASPDAGIFGGTADGTGGTFLANQGITLGNGSGTVGKSASTNVNGCIITSTTAKVAGGIDYVLAP